jgi:hypothetical protein
MQVVCWVTFRARRAPYSYTSAGFVSGALPYNYEGRAAGLPFEVKKCPTPTGFLGPLTNPTKAGANGGNTYLHLWIYFAPSLRRSSNQDLLHLQSLDSLDSLD